MVKEGRKEGSKQAKQVVRGNLLTARSRRRRAGAFARGLGASRGSGQAALGGAAACGAAGGGIVAVAGQVAQGAAVEEGEDHGFEVSCDEGVRADDAVAVDSGVSDDWEG